MEKKAIISTSQLFCMLFLSRIAISIMYSGLVTNNSNMTDHILSAGLSFLATFLLIIPVYKLFKMDSKFDISDNLINTMGKFGYVLITVYILYYLLVSSYTVANLNNFIINTMNPPIPITTLAITLIIIACYGAYKGIEGLARASSIIFLIIVLSSLCIIFSLIPNINIQNFKPFLYNGSESMWEGTVYMLSHNSTIPLMAMLLPFAKGKIKSGIFFWNIGVYLLISVGIFLMVGTMGDYLKTQLFPVYSTLSIAKISELQHLDSIYLGLWTTSIFIKISLFLYVSSECVKKMFGEDLAKYSIPIFGIVVVCGSVFVGGTGVWSGLFNINFLFWSMILTSVIIPLILIIIKSVIKKGEKKI